MAPNDEPAEWLSPTRGAKTLPAVEVLTGRGFITGKSGSGKSNTASVIAEELLDNGYGLLVVDTEGEYYGLADEYDLLHAGNDDEYCDITVGPDDAGHLASTAVEENVPVILDVSDFLDGELARELIANVVRELYHREKEARKPFLLMIEELQEYLPQSGGGGELADLLERVAKRGRKRGLGMLGMSQRPSSVDKDFITQCDWMVWHRLTWKNDVDVVRNILGSDVASSIEDLDTGEAYVMTDWDDEVERVQFKRKRTHDAGATPGLDAYRDGPTPTESDYLHMDDSGDLSGGSGGATESAAGDGLADVTTSDVESAKAQLRGLTLDLDDETELAAASQEELVEAVRAYESYVEALEADREALESSLRASVRAERSGPTRPDRSDADRPPEPRERDSAPKRPAPQPPMKPENRTGFSGNLVEFTEMSVYLVRALVYRFRLLAYRLGTGPAEEGRRR